MDWYFYIAIAAIVSQLVFLLQTYNNFRYALAKYKKKRLWHKLQVALIVPCKGLDSDFQKNVASFFNQDYENYRLWFVVADQSDPAYNELCKLKDQLSQTCKAREVQIFIAGQAKSCSQKIHNLLYCYQRISDDIDILAFADSDICCPQRLVKSPCLASSKVQERRSHRLSLVRPEKEQPGQLSSIRHQRQDCPTARQHPF